MAMKARRATRSGRSFLLLSLSCIAVSLLICSLCLPAAADSPAQGGDVETPTKDARPVDAAPQQDIKVDTPPKEIETPPKKKKKVKAPPKEATSPPTEVETPPTEVETPPKTVETPPKEVETPPQEVETPPKPVETSPNEESGGGGSNLGGAPPEEDKGSGGMDILLIVTGVVTVVVGIGGYCVLFSGPPKRKFTGDAVFLLGACDSGKTSLLFHLRDGTTGNALPATHTSMTYNESKFTLEDDESSKTLRVIDFPGHPRLRPLLFDIIEDCAAVVFVIDACTFSNQAKEISSFVLDLMTSTAMLKHCSSMIIVCNKTDALPDDMAGVSPKIKIRSRLEKEVEALRKTRAESLDDIGNTLRVELEIEGDTFKWSDAPINVEFTDASVMEGETKAVKSFLINL